jgi:hypothetical protein
LIVSHNADTATLCYLSGFVQEVPFQRRMFPFPIPLTI